MNDLYKVISPNKSLKGQYRHDQQENRSAIFKLTQRLKIISHMIRSYYRCCCINEPP